MASGSRSRTSPAGSAPGPADRTEFLGRNGALDRPAALAGGAALSNRVGAGLDPCAALQTPLELRPNQRAEIVFLLGQAATAAEARELIARYRAADLDALLRSVTRRWDERARGRAGEDARSRPRPPAEPLAALPDARLPGLGAVGLLPGERRLRLPRPAPGRHGPRGLASRSSPGSICCAPPRGSSWRATSSTGGCRRRGTGCAPASPTTRSGWPTPSLHYIRVTGDRAVLDERVPFLDGPALARRRARRLLPARGLRGVRHALRALRAGARRAPRRRRSRPAAHRRRRLERRHEPRRRRRARARASGSAGSSRPRCRPSRPLAEARGEDVARGGLAAPRRRAAPVPRATRLGRRLVPARLLRRRQRRSAPRPATSAGSTRSRSPGRCSPAPGIRRGRGGRWPRSTSTSSAAATDWCCSSRRPSTARRAIPATSRAIRPASARTAASTPTPPSGP